MSMYEWLKRVYGFGGATLEQCKRAVEKAKITKEQYKDITGLDYEK